MSPLTSASIPPATAGGVKRLHPFGAVAVELSEDQALQRPRSGYHSRPGKGRSHVRDPADQLRLVIRRPQERVLRHTVLKRHQCGFRPDQRPGLLQCRLRVPQLDAHHHKVDRTNLARLVRGADVLEKERVRAALDPKPFLSYRLQMRTPGDEAHLGPAARQQSAEIAAKATRSHHSHPHPAYQTRFQPVTSKLAQYYRSNRRPGTRRLTGGLQTRIHQFAWRTRHLAPVPLGAPTRALGASDEGDVRRRRGSGGGLRG